MPRIFSSFGVRLWLPSTPEWETHAEHSEPYMGEGADSSLVGHTVSIRELENLTKLDLHNAGYEGAETGGGVGVVAEELKLRGRGASLTCF